MKLSIGIVGLPNVGKSTLFNALTKKSVPAQNYPFCTIDPSVGIVAVPDERVKILSDFSKSAKTIPAAIEFVDIAGLVAGASKGEGLGNKFLSHIREVDAIAHVVRCFENGDVVHVHGNVDPLRDIEVINTELALADMESVEKALNKAGKTSKSGNKEALAKAKPQVSKNSAGYYLWNVWDEQKQIFDLTKLIVGSQGTLGIVTEAKLRLVPVQTKSKLFVIFLRDLSKLSELVNTILELQPESLESYDDATMALAVKFFPEMVKSMKAANFIKLMWSFIPEALMMLSGGLPKLILLVEFAGDNEQEIDAKMRMLAKVVKPFNYKTHVARTAADSEKYWTIRRESFNLLRKHVAGRRTAPFIDDIIVAPKHMPEFLPKIRAILDSYKLTYTIAGHAGNGNFHIIPLMDMKDTKNVDVIMEVGEKVYDLVVSYGGSITAEHNDGIVRTAYLPKMFSPEILGLFRKTKELFDPLYIFNPGKKVGMTLDYFKKHIIRE